ncbi:MAG TPA: hypothetical protein IAC63_01685 [Candidatus Enterousia avicola]|uniref:Uncharacterized protein n=1 Tax=Candidatus Enterousia avicola TaxID=2840787 RepID=A0A9D1SM61_9PROT|nr:hypothetical protein [Candidatus Enterousia avicola]
MSDDLFTLLLLAIQKTFISVENTDTGSSYYFILRDDSEIQEIELQCLYSHTDEKNTYAKCNFYVNGFLLEEAFIPVFQGKKPQKFNKLTTSAKLEILLRACSQKVIKQEIECQKFNMLKTFKKNSKQRSN